MSEHASVIKYFRQAIIYEIIMAVFSSVVVWYSQSFTAIFPLLFAISGVMCMYLMLYTVKAAAKGDIYHYPYGTGRLENLSSILDSTLLTVGAMVPFVQAIQNLISGKTHEVNMGWTSLLILLSSLGNYYQCRWALHLYKKNGGPILSTNYYGYHAGFVRDACSFFLIGACWYFQKGDQAFMSKLDSISTIVLTLYSLYNFIPQIWLNFRSLADFPTSEDNQIKIMAILAKYFDRYEQLGMIYTTNKGKNEIFEVELEFKQEMPVCELLKLEEEIRQDFQKQFPDCIFRIIPVKLRKEVLNEP